MPFWKDAKDHTVGSADLEAATALRMAANEARSNLYPQLKDGFLAWWDERRRWTNAPFEPIESPRASYVYRPLNVTIKIDNILAIRDFGGKDHFVYPYFYPEPALSESIARIGLWMLGRALPSASWEEIRLLDVIRGESFSVERLPLLGNEELNFIKNYTELHRQWTEIRDDYPT